MKRRSIFITENNIKYIAGRIGKWVKNAGPINFLTIHDFDCGWTPSSFENAAPSRYYHCDMKTSWESRPNYKGDSYIVLTYYACKDSPRMLELHTGDRIMFLGDTLAMQIRWNSTHYNYLYVRFMYYQQPLMYPGPGPFKNYDPNPCSLLDDEDPNTYLDDGDTWDD